MRSALPASGNTVKVGRMAIISTRHDCRTRPIPACGDELPATVDRVSCRFIAEDQRTMLSGGPAHSSSVRTRFELRIAFGTPFVYLFTRKQLGANGKCPAIHSLCQSLARPRLRSSSEFFPKTAKHTGMPCVVCQNRSHLSNRVTGPRGLQVGHSPRRHSSERTGTKKHSVESNLRRLQRITLTCGREKRFPACYGCFPRARTTTSFRKLL